MELAHSSPLLFPSELTPPMISAEVTFDAIIKLVVSSIVKRKLLGVDYGVAIIMLTIIIRGLLIPLNVKSQKSMLKMQALSGKQAGLQRKYGDDKEKYQEALMEMQKENG